VDVEDDVRAGQVEQVRITGDFVGVVGEAVAGVVLRRQLGALDHRPPRTVEHRDPLIQQFP
jgi:hypothetical protein